MAQHFSVDEVLFFQSDEEQTRVVAAGDEAHIRKPLEVFAEGLDAEEFWQVRRGLLVRAAAVSRLQRDEPGRIHAAPEEPCRAPGGQPGLGLTLLADAKAPAARRGAGSRDFEAAAGGRHGRY